MQNQQKHNKNITPSSSHNQKKYQLLKCKGKPFWLNLSKHKNQNYQKYNSLLNPQTSIIFKENQQITTAHQYLNSTPQKQSCLQSLLSFNQNYDQDFQSYKQTIRQQTQQKIFYQSARKKLVLSKKLDIKILQLQSKILKTPKRKVNFSSLSRIKTQKINKIKCHSRAKTQEHVKSQSVDIQKQIYMNENPKYLQRQNQRMLQLIKQMRKLLPILNKNHQEINSQQFQINSLKEKVQKATSAQYGFILEKDKSFLESNRKMIQRNIKILNSPKKSQSKPLTFRNNVNQNIFITEQRVRQQLLCKLRLSTLRQVKFQQLNKKIHFYEEIIQKISKKQKISSFSSLQRRKIFLQWDIQRMKNQYDLKILQQNIEINSLMEQIQMKETKILQIQKFFIHVSQKNQKQSQQNLMQKENQIHSVSKITHLNPQLPFSKSLKKQKNQNQISSFKVKSSPSNQKTIFCQKLQKQKPILSLNQKSLPEIPQNKTNFPQIQSLKTPNQKQIRIKKFAFKNANLNEDLDQLIL